MPRENESFQILEKINDNSYKVDLPSEYSVSVISMFFYLSLFDVGDDSWTNPFEERGWYDRDYTKRSIASSNWTNYKVKRKETYRCIQ